MLHRVDVPPGPKNARPLGKLSLMSLAEQKRHAHDLVDRLDAGQLGAVVRLLEVMTETRVHSGKGTYRMKLTAVFEPAQEGGYTCFVEEIPAAISQGETLEEAKANLREALQLVLECQRELAEKNVSPAAVREVFDVA